MSRLNIRNNMNKCLTHYKKPITSLSPFIRFNNKLVHNSELKTNYTHTIINKTFVNKNNIGDKIMMKSYLNIYDYLANKYKKNIPTKKGINILTYFCVITSFIVALFPFMPLSSSWGVFIWGLLLLIYR
jgi:hypothetical protein